MDKETEVYFVSASVDNKSIYACGGGFTSDEPKDAAIFLNKKAAEGEASNYNYKHLESGLKFVAWSVYANTIFC